MGHNGIGLGLLLHLPKRLTWQKGNPAFAGQHHSPLEEVLKIGGEDGLF